MQEAIGLVLNAQLALDRVVVGIVVGPVAKDVLRVVRRFAIDLLMAELLPLDEILGDRGKTALHCSNRWSATFAVSSFLSVGILVQCSSTEPLDYVGICFGGE